MGAYGTTQMVLTYAMMVYYRLKLNGRWDCRHGSWCASPNSICNCWNGPTVNLLCWLSLQLSNEFPSQYYLRYQVIDKVVYVRVKCKSTRRSLFPLRQRNYTQQPPELFPDLDPDLVPMICRHNRINHLKWSYAGYDRLWDAGVDPSPVYGKMTLRIHNITSLLYFIYAANTTLNIRDEDADEKAAEKAHPGEMERQRKLLTALFLAQPLICRNFCETILAELNNQSSVFADPSVLLFLGSVLHDLFCSMCLVLRGDNSSLRWKHIGYYSDIVNENDLYQHKSLTKKFQTLLTDSCYKLSNYRCLIELWEKINSWLPEGDFYDGSDLKETRYFFEEIFRALRCNAAGHRRNPAQVSF